MRNINITYAKSMFMRSARTLITTLVLMLSGLGAAAQAPQASISGPTTLCKVYTAEYSVVGSTATTGFTWTVTGSLAITSGQGTNKITVSFFGPGLDRRISFSGNTIAATVLVQVYDTSTPSAISGPTTVCKGGIATYSINPMTMPWLTRLEFFCAGGATKIASTGNTITLQFASDFTQSTIVAYGVFGSCGAGPAVTLSVSASATAPAAAGTISGPAIVAPGQSNVDFSVPAITGASGYQWSLPTGATIASGSGTRTIFVNFPSNFSGGTVSVSGTAGICVGPPSSLAIISCNIPATPGTISGSSTVTQGNLLVAYSITALTNATGYVWTLPPGASIATGTNTNSITVNYSATATSGSISVYGTNANCNGATGSKPITVTPLVGPAGTITGGGGVCANETERIYHVPEISGVNLNDLNNSRYVWSFSPSVVIPLGDPNRGGDPRTNVMKIRFPAYITATNITITVHGTKMLPDGTWATGTPSSKNEPISLPPGNIASISGPAFIADGVTSAVYSVKPVTNASDYVWVIPANTGISATGTGASRTLTFSSSFVFGQIEVYATNGSCPPGGRAVLYIQRVMNKNYVMERTVKEAGILLENDIKQDPGKTNLMVQYFDGLGRKEQSVVWRGSPSQKDLVQLHVYDQYGREAVNYLPYTGGNDSRYKDNPLGPTYATSPQYSFYQNTTAVATDTKPYAVKVFEPSPLNRMIEEGRAGADWQPDATNSYTSSDHTMKASYNSNEANEVLRWTYAFPSSSFPFGKVNSVNGSGQDYYPAKELIKLKTKDEQGNEVITYTDKFQRIVLRRVQYVTSPASINDTNYSSTYYVYDYKSNLVAVIQPEGVKVLATQYFGKTDAEKETFLAKWAFRYVYDSRNRTAMKHFPGVEPIFLVYDGRNRVVLVQEGNQRKDAAGAITKKDWTYTKYDAHNRPVISGIFTHDAVVDQAGMQSVVNTFYSGTLAPAKAWFETYTGSGTYGYDNKSFPPALSTTYISVLYYDNYNFKSLISGTDDNYTSGDLTGQETAEFTGVAGQVTGGHLKILGTSTFMWHVNYYDKEHRLIQVKNKNRQGLIDRMTRLYDFAGQILQEKFVTNHSTTSTIVTRRYEYDHSGREIRVWNKMGTGAEVLLVKKEYNELGQLIDKKLHSTNAEATDALQSVDYRYNIRGWLTKINEADVAVKATGDTDHDYFGMELVYNKTFAGISSTPSFNGNISALQWSKGDRSVRRQSYVFNYDPMSRMLDANHFDYKVTNGVAAWESVGNAYGENVTYDYNGNVSTLTRRGFTGALVDNLSYTYNGNQLSFVNDSSSPTLGFLNGNTGTDDFSYDWNGNIDMDKNKGLNTKGNISYNHMNLVQEVVKGSEKVKYIYDAKGRKLAQQLYDAAGTVVKTTEYKGENVYEDNALKFVRHPEGRIIPNGTGWEYQYDLKDHLDNVRITFTNKTTTNTSTSTDFEAATNGNFQNYSSHTFDLVDHTDAGTTYQKSQLLNGGQFGRVGLAKSFSVMPGDRINATAYVKYMGLTATGNPNSLITSLANAFGVSASSTGESLKLYNGLSSYAALVPGGQHENDDDVPPKIFITVLFFDKDYNFLDAAWDQVSTVGLQSSGSIKEPPHDQLSVNAVAPEAGFAYVFFSNEHPTYVNAYFDDAYMGHSPSRIVGVNDYFPYGLPYNNKQRESSTPNPYGYNNMEVQDELSLQWLDYGARMYMPEIARWGIIDPLSEKMRRWSPYTYCFDNPVRFIDPDGMSPGDPHPWRALLDKSSGKLILINPTPLELKVLQEAMENGVQVFSPATHTVELGDKFVDGSYNPLKVLQQQEFDKLVTEFPALADLPHLQGSLIETEKTNYIGNYKHNENGNQFTRVMTLEKLEANNIEPEVRDYIILDQATVFSKTDYVKQYESADAEGKKFVLDAARETLQKRDDSDARYHQENVWINPETGGVHILDQPIPRRALMISGEKGVITW
jgi:RHS repeat-associated protein